MVPEVTTAVGMSGMKKFIMTTGYLWLAYKGDETVVKNKQGFATDTSVIEQKQLIYFVTTLLYLYFSQHCVELYIVYVIVFALRAPDCCEVLFL